jgi:hypothetical protein
MHDRSVLLIWTSVLALCATGALAAGLPIASVSGEANPPSILWGARVLYNQNSNFAGDVVDSQNFTSGHYSAYDDAGADDFVVPEGVTWRITEVDVSGQYFNGSGPARSENVIFYKNKLGRPGKNLRNGRFNHLKGVDSGGNFAITLPNEGLTLKPGTYWVSVIANLNFNKGGEWGWDVSSVQNGNQAVWRNPCFGQCGVCGNAWGTIEYCVNASGPDFMFDLRGKRL